MRKTFFYCIFVSSSLYCMESQLPLERITKGVATITLEESVRYEDAFSAACCNRMKASELSIATDEPITKNSYTKLLCNRYIGNGNFDLDLVVFDFLEKMPRVNSTTFLDGLLCAIKKEEEKKKEKGEKIVERKITYERLIVNYLQYAIIKHCSINILMVILSYYPDIESRVLTFDKYWLNMKKTVMDAIGLALSCGNEEAAIFLSSFKNKEMNLFP